MATAEPGHFPNIHHLDVMRSIFEQIPATGDAVGVDRPGRTVPAVTIDSWLFDEFAARGADLEDCEPEPIESDD